MRTQTRKWMLVTWDTLKKMTGKYVRFGDGTKKDSCSKCEKPMCTEHAIFMSTDFSDCLV